MQFKTKLWLFIVGAILLEFLSVKAMAGPIYTTPSSGLWLLAVAATIFILVFGILLIINSRSLAVSKLKDEINNERELKEAYKLALNDVVEKFGESGMNMHRSTLEKLNSLSRARSVLGRIKG